MCEEDRKTDAWPVTTNHGMFDTASLRTSCCCCCRTIMQQWWRICCSRCQCWMSMSLLKYHALASPASKPGIDTFESILFAAHH